MNIKRTLDAFLIIAYSLVFIIIGVYLMALGTIYGQVAGGFIGLSVVWTIYSSFKLSRIEKRKGLKRAKASHEEKDKE